MVSASDHANARPRIALLWHRAEDQTKARRARLDGVFRALTALGATAEAVVWADETADAARQQLLASDGVLVWVNPITSGRDRTASMRGLWTVRPAPERAVLAEAEHVLQRIMEQYFEPNLSVEEVRALARSADGDPLKAFGEACRAELKSMRGVV